MQKCTVILLASVAATAVPGMSLSVARAQEAAPQAVQEASLQPVIVTAQRRKEDMQHVPISVASFNALELNTLQVTTATDLAQIVPGLSMQTFNGATLPFLRGIGLQNSGPWQESPVSTYVDGVYYINPNISTVVLNNIQSVEVDKGPQGTLFGRNAVGGVIQYETRDPRQTPEADVAVGYGNYATTSASLYATTGITDKLAANIAIAADDQREGWGRDLYNGAYVDTQYSYSARSKWELTPDKNTKLMLILDWATAQYPISEGIERGEYPFITTGPSQVGGYYDTYLPTTPYRHYTQYGVSLTADRDLGWAKFVSISAVRRDGENKNVPYPFSPPFLPETPAVGQLPGLKTNAAGDMFDNTGTEELRLLSPSSSAITWVGGAFILFNDSGFNYLNNVKTVPPTGETATVAMTEQTTRSYSAYAQATAPIFTDATRLTAGLRYTADRREVYGEEIANTLSDPAVFKVVSGSTAADNPEPSHTWTKPTFRTALQHDFTNDVMGYVSFSTGFESAYYNISVNASGAPLKPVTIEAYEAGLKTQWLDDRLRANSSLFLYDLTNVVVTQHYGGHQVSANAAQARIEGIDVDLAAKPMRDLTVTVSLEYLDAEYTNYADAIAYVPAVGGEYSVVAVNADGLPLQYTEKFVATATAQYAVSTDVGRFLFVGDVNSNSSTYYDTQNLNVLPGYALVNGSVGWMSNDGRWGVTVWGKNLTDRQYATLYPSSIIMSYYPEAPRTYGVRFSYHWN